MTEKQASLFPTTRVTLIQSLGDPHSEAWEIFFRLYGPIVYRMARHAALSPDDAEEVVAIVMRNFVQAVRGGFEVDHRIGRFRSYLRTITNREIGKLRRKAGAGGGGGEWPAEEVAESPDPAPETTWSDVERRERVRLCLETLRRAEGVPERDRQAFEQYTLEGRPADAVAERFGLTVNRLYGIKHEMIRRLRRIRSELDRELGEV